MFFHVTHNCTRGEKCKFSHEAISPEELAELKKAVDLDLYIKDTELAVTLTGEAVNEEYVSLPQDAIIIVDDYLY